MIFPYRRVGTYRRDSEDAPIEIFEPLIPVEIIGPTGEVQFDALVDTGSQITVFPSISSSNDHLTGRNTHLRAIDGKAREVFEGKDIKLKLILDGKIYIWPCNVWFSKDDNTKPTLGIHGFMEFFTVTLDGAGKTVALNPNKNFPGIVDNLWKKDKEA